MSLILNRLPRFPASAELINAPAEKAIATPASISTGMYCISSSITARVISSQSLGKNTQQTVFEAQKPALPPKSAIHDLRTVLLFVTSSHDYPKEFSVGGCTHFSFRDSCCGFKCRLEEYSAHRER